MGKARSLHSCLRTSLGPVPQAFQARICTLVPSAWNIPPPSSTWLTPLPPSDLCSNLLDPTSTQNSAHLSCLILDDHSSRSNILYDELGHFIRCRLTCLEDRLCYCPQPEEGLTCRRPLHEESARAGRGCALHRRQTSSEVEGPWVCTPGLTWPGPFVLSIFFSFNRAWDHPRGQQWGPQACHTSASLGGEAPETLGNMGNGPNSPRKLCTD